MVNINMPLPDSCASCPLSVRHFGKLYCPPLNDRVGNEGKDGRCPLHFVTINDHADENKVTNCNDNDLISRQDAITIPILPIEHRKYQTMNIDDAYELGWFDCQKCIEELPSAQPEQHTCVNCGRTVNNGGWYADGGTRCPIEEHYALPKDGYCHLWEKRNVTDDNYPERRTDGEIIPE